ncbi:hypothetical protein AB8B21_05550 [Tardiphaga sp. 866_E4_N2_1]|uniref:hypothetical protein n=1 Tax=unclassified Tardiphaga TaxID=2631404 RepID=UPI003F26A4D9
MDPMEALKHVRTFIRVAAQTDDVDAIHRNLKEAETLIAKVLSPARQPKSLPASKKPASPLDKILDEPRIGLGNEQNAREKAKNRSS